MIQLELDPRFMYPEHSSEIEDTRSQILRTKFHNRWGPKFKEISLDYALSDLYKTAFDTVKNNPELEKSDKDRVINSCLIKALPYLQGVLQGEEEPFDSISHFKHMYKKMVHNTAITEYRKKQAFSRQASELDNLAEPDLPTRTTRNINREGFQPVLIRLEETATQKQETMKRLSEELGSPVVLRSDYLNSRPYRTRALQLWCENPHFSSRDVVKILRLEGYRKFNDSSVRVWFLRYKRAQGLHQLVGA